MDYILTNIIRQSEIERFSIKKKKISNEDLWLSGVWEVKVIKTTLIQMLTNILRSYNFEVWK